MTTAWFNFERFLEITSLVITAALLLLRLLQVPEAKARLRYLYLTLGVILLAPFCFLETPRFGVPQLVALPVTIPYELANNMEMASAVRPRGPLDYWNDLDLGWQFLIVVALLRVLWLCVGLVRLHLYRRRAELLCPLPDHLRTLRTQLRVDAELYLSKEVNGPVTFGFSSPAVLLPESFLELSLPQQSAVVCHEFEHIRRNDPLKVFGEEVLRSALWFHPFIWWLLGRIQLCREQVVDEATIAITEDRETYLETLLEFAQRNVTMPPDLAPATPFFKRSHLLERVKSIAQEVDMPAAIRRLHLLALHVIMPCVLALAIWKLPLKGQSQFVPDTAGVRIMTPYTLMHRLPVEFPTNAIRGEVVVHVKLDDVGEVRDSKVMSGPEELRASVLRSVQGWHFVKDAPKEFDVAVANDGSLVPERTSTSEWESPSVIRSIDVSSLPADMRASFLGSLPLKEGDTTDAKSPLDFYKNMSGFDSRVELRIQRAQRKLDLTYLMRGPGSPPLPPPPPPDTAQLRVTRIGTEGMADGQRAFVLATLKLRVGDTVTMAEMEGRREALKAIDRRLRINTMIRGDMTIQLDLMNTETMAVKVAAINVEELDAAMAERARAALGFFPGETMTLDQLNEKMALLSRSLPRVHGTIAFRGPHEVAVVVRKLFDETDRLKLASIDSSGLPEDRRQRALQALGLRAGDLVSQVELKGKLAELHSLDAGITPTWTVSGDPAEIMVRFVSPDFGPSSSVDDRSYVSLGRIDTTALSEPLRSKVGASMPFQPGEVIMAGEFKKRLETLRGIDQTLRVTLDGSHGPKLDVVLHSGQLSPAVGALKTPTITNIDVSSLPEGLRQPVLDTFRFHVGQVLTNEQLMERLAAIRALDRHLDSAQTYTELIDPKVAIRFYMNSQRSNIEMPVATVKPIVTVEPIYPPLARQARVQGTVRFEVTVGPEGTVSGLRLMAGHPLLVPAATEAARQYRFPSSSSGLKTALDINFILKQ